MEFIEPPPFGSFTEYDENPVYPLGTVVEVEWTPGPEESPTSLTLWQINSTTGAFFGDMEYVTRKAVDTSDFRWIVATTKDLTASEVFFLTIFEEGNTAGDANSHYFNITQTTDDDDPLTTTTISTTTEASTSTEVSTVSSTAITTTTEAAAATSSAPVSSDSGGLSSSATIAISVVIPCVVILAAIAGYILFRKRRKQRSVPITNMYHGQADHQGNHYPYDPYNGAARGQWVGGEPLKQDHPAELGASEKGPTGLFELHAPHH